MNQLWFEWQLTLEMDVNHMIFSIFWSKHLVHLSWLVKMSMPWESHWSGRKRSSKIYFGSTRYKLDCGKELDNTAKTADGDHFFNCFPSKGKEACLVGSNVPVTPIFLSLCSSLLLFPCEILIFGTWIGSNQQSQDHHNH